MGNVTKKKPVRKPGQTVVAVALAAPLHKKLKNKAIAERRSLSKQLGLVVETYLDSLPDDRKGVA